MFGNLLSNALKYSPAGGPVRFVVGRQDGALHLCVQDQGIGIPEDEQADMFDSFHRASNVGDIEGTGLGLSIVKKAVELHGGTITVQSAAGAGTRFCILLPDPGNAA